MVKLSVQFFILLSVLFLAMHANSKQLNFTKEEQDSHYQFNYQWLDINQEKQSLSFSLSKKKLFSPFRNFKAYKPDFAARYVQRKVRRALKKNPLQGVSVYFTSIDNVRISGSNQKAIREAQSSIATMEQKFLNEYLQQQYYHTFTTHNNIAAVKPDHIRIAQLSAPILAPTKQVILDTVSIRNIRRVTNYVLGFVQSIPYSPLTSRVSSSGAGFNVPVKVLWENQGDCDSKMTLTAAILRALMPRINMIMVYIDEHAFIGIDIPPEANDTVINVQGINFVLADPTGPSLMNLGKISFDSEQAIYAGHYTAEHFN